jgi:tetratricopeptide (TPR) repeat protein
MEANKLYINKEYEKALEKYLEIEKTNNVSKSLYLNIGNTYFRQNNYAQAILYYNRGLLLSPNDASLINNLKVSKARLKGEAYSVPDFFLYSGLKKISHIFSPNQWRILSIILIVIASVIFIFYYYSYNKKLIFLISFIFVLLLFVSTIFNGIYREKEFTNKNFAIVISNNVVGKEYPEANAADKTSIFKGQKVKIINRESSWIEVKAEDGKQMWIEKSSVIII